MSKIIEQLTPEQEALIPLYREKWRKIALCTEPCDRQKAVEAVKALYAAFDFANPEIIYCDSPYDCLKILVKTLDSLPQRTLNFQILIGLLEKTYEQLNAKIKQQLFVQLYGEIFQELKPIKESIEAQLNHQVDRQMAKYIQPRYLPRVEVHLGCDADFRFSVLNCDRGLKKWEAFRLTIDCSGWILPYEKICFVCDRPRILSFDSRQRLHAEASPAIQFADGFSIYAYHGVRLPEKYGKIHPDRWQSQWLLSEDNAELRRVLIQGIGYDRIGSELPIIKIDTWQEYDLLKIDSDVDLEPIYLLKMTCPSTGFIHVLRVPPDVRSAKAGITWINWGTAPEEFSIQT